MARLINPISSGQEIDRLGSKISYFFEYCYSDGFYVRKIEDYSVLMLPDEQPSGDILASLCSLCLPHDLLTACAVCETSRADVAPAYIIANSPEAFGHFYFETSGSCFVIYPDDMRYLVVTFNLEFHFILLKNDILKLFYNDKIREICLSFYREISYITQEKDNYYLTSSIKSINEIYPNLPANAFVKFPDNLPNGSMRKWPPPYNPYAPAVKRLLD